MSVIRAEIRPGAYYDSVVLMQLQRALVELPGVEDAGVVMGTEANKELLAQVDLLTPEVASAAADDLVIVVKAESEEAALQALSQVDELLKRRRSKSTQQFRPKTLESATKVLPEAQWVLISVPGRYAAGVAREALRLGRHVFLYSDNVALDDEIDLKKHAAEKGLLVMGPDCGTAIINGVGLGFANKVRRGPIGVVAAAGTGLQTVTSRIHQLGSGVSQAIGTGGRDLSEKVGARTTLAGLDVLARDPETQVIVIISKPPSPKVAEKVLRAARTAGKPVVVNFVGYTPTTPPVGNITYASTLDEAARQAVALAQALGEAPAVHWDTTPFAEGQRYLRGLYSGGTLAYEALLLLRDMLPQVYTNLHMDGVKELSNPMRSEKHTVVDLGEDVFTVGRLHPMMDNDLRIRRLRQEGEDPQVAVILMDVVLGYGAHPDPASELAPAVEEVLAQAEEAGRHLEVVVTVVGTEEDPQNLDAQLMAFDAAGAKVFTDHVAAVHYAGYLARMLDPDVGQKPIPLDAFHSPFAAINVGLESFAESLAAQGAQVVHVDWRPPAGGNERLMALLARMKK
ncbi:MAG: acyl-CoA synthetase FdrA [Chloroflexi bacterium]|nr:acyl-CoA synthetase FdrA [Chloroflexota bacterium]